jgi:hypothetical protein
MIYAVTPEWVEFIPPVNEMKDGVLYISLKYNTCIHLCACGCGQQTVTPFNHSQGWVMTSLHNKVTLRPSIGNFQYTCRSHYYITDNMVEWL